MYINDDFDKGKIISDIMEISQKREDLATENKLNREKEVEMIYQQFYRGLKLCTGNYKI